MKKLTLRRLLAVAISVGAVFIAFTPETSHRCDAAQAVAKSIFVDHTGRGDFKTIQAAIDSVPFGNNQWIRVHVAARTYTEKVTVPFNKSFILLEGEGRLQTSIEWADHAGGSSTTADTPTFASHADDFMARDITFKNTYDGASLAQAVAALVDGDRSSFYGCGFFSVQDTLCDMAGRHYYENCVIGGAVDFIFSNARSIFQGCNLWTGKLTKTLGSITAHGRDSDKDDTAFVFKQCKVGGFMPIYLGRPWRDYARVIFYQTNMSTVVDRQGWDIWNSKGKEGLLTMVESECIGAGSNTTERVPWAKQLSGKEIATFVSLSYISPDGWLDAQPH
ncbi:hypothetical protein CFC21_101144 [Triticum aestivum]|uniref:pectinesterase n=3 Tax=Triticum TaxID=4564 RepID=A0A9R1M2L5_WHEAT|nr:probable pectinesterase 29 [Triticum aestivum]KAF7099516.1 hypothetical protein CFC21_101140 [Triticum aestivum]KAF7099520.1 hypothetical protein CFC21_101144 [Triticum aestivum]VAI82800.1 unnamed protein product [Triticum turgidum subsp. durum]